MRRSLFYSAISAGSAVFMLLLLVMAGRWLGVEDFGVFSAAISLATIAEVFMDFGLHQVTIRAIARDATRAGHLLRTSLWLKALPGLGMVAVFTLIAFRLRPESSFRVTARVRCRQPRPAWRLRDRKPAFRRRANMITCFRSSNHGA